MTKKLLVVEDLGFINTKIQTIGIKHGYEVHSAKDLITTKELISVHDFDLAIVDYRLPDGDSGESVDATTNAKIPSIVVTATMDSDLRTKILNKKVVDYFQKDSLLTFEYIDRMLTRLNANQNYHVLVVDDSKIARMSITSLLNRHLYKVLEADNGYEALDLMEKHNDIKIIITDQEMPEMDGIELVRNIRAKHSKDDIAIIGISSNGNSAMSAKFIKYGANDFIVKPFCEEEFYCRLTHNIEFMEQIWKIQELANTDFLTKLHNRRHLTEMIESDANYRLKPMSLAIIDIDHFKRINDSFGHDVGDLALVHLANIMIKTFPNEYPARFGGEEFCIVSSLRTKEDFIEQIEKLRLAIQNKPFTYDGKNISFTISAGCVHSAKSLREMLIDADTLLYKAKKTGRNKIVLE